MLLQMDHGSLCGGSSREPPAGGTATPIPLMEVFSSSWESRPSQPRVQLREGRTWFGEGGRGHPPSQPDQPNQPR